MHHLRGILSEKFREEKFSMGSENDRVTCYSLGNVVSDRAVNYNDKTLVA